MFNQVLLHLKNQLRNANCCAPGESPGPTKGVIMASVKNHVIYSSDRDYLERLRHEYVDYVGRSAILEQGRLVVLALPLKKPKKKH